MIKAHNKARHRDATKRSALFGARALNRFKMKIHALIISILLVYSLSSFSEDREKFVLIFDKYNETLKTVNIKEIEKYLVKVQVSALKECRADSICGKSAIEGMRNGALSEYKITNYVEYAKGGRITNILDNNQKIDKVSGPAVQLYYEGVEVSGHKGKGDATFIIEDGVWKISMTSWGSRQ